MYLIIQSIFVARSRQKEKEKVYGVLTNAINDLKLYLGVLCRKVSKQNAPLSLNSVAFGVSSTNHVIAFENC